MHHHGHRSERGQATSEYVAVLAVVALLVGVAGTIAASGTNGVANAVLGQMRRALCIVTSASCRAQAPRACVVSTDREHRHLAATVVLARLDDDHVLLRERLSDGTVRITIAERTGAGVEVGLGAHARIQAGGRSIGVGTELRAALLGVFGDGRVFHAADDRAADELVEEVMGRELPLAVDRPYRIARGLLGLDDGGLEADELYVEGGARALAEAGVRLPGVEAGAHGLAEAALGARIDRRTGERTVYLRAGRGGGALVTALLGSVEGASATDALLALTADARGRPVELALLASGGVAGAGRLSPGLAGALGGGGPAAGQRGRRWELHARADLGDPGMAAAWAAYRDAPGSAEAVRRLGLQLAARAHVDARTYRTASETSGVSGAVALGVKLAGEARRTLDRSTLLAAASRPPGGLWERRADCVTS